LKKCKVCEVKFEPKYTSFQKTCNEMACIISWGKREAQRKALAEDRKKRKEYRDNDRGWWLRKAQAQFNKYIRVRDAGQPCISCQKVMTGQIHAGHYRSTGAHPELRFEPLNCHAQCAQCNNFKSGNLTAYRVNLIRKIGEKNVVWLEGPHESKRFTIDDLKNIVERCKAQINCKSKVIRT